MPQTKPTLRLDWCSHAAAKYACEKWHYSGRLISTFTRPVYIGVWEDGKFIGAVVFSHGANKNIGCPYGLTQYECCELVRIALTDHAAPVSRILSIALRMVTRQSPGIRLIVSYADCGEGHIGAIYQASNLVYVGLVTGSPKYYMNGRLVHQRAVDCSRNGRAGLRVVPPTSKHKYLMPLDDAMRAQVAPLAKPYPKRICAASIDSDAPGFQPEEGGADPTAALQLTD